MLDSIISQNGFFSILLFFVLGAFGSLAFYKSNRSANWWGNSCAIAGSLSGLLFSVGILFVKNIPSFEIQTAFPLLSFSFHIDYLSAFFVFCISLISLLCSIYAFGYVSHFYKKYSIGALGFFYNLFIASMLLVVTVHNLLFFLIVWEIMSLVSYFLVIFERKKEENIKAGSLYFNITHAGTACIIFAFLLLYSVTGSFDFDVIQKGIAPAPELLKSTIFLFCLVGFGVKMGLIPLHSWLPSAHPAAPSHISALMSGVMIKTGVYMLMRICFEFFSGGPLWWGLLLLILGSISSLLGVLYALTEHDVKKLLAYHSIENIGIILLGFGSSLVFLSANMKTLAIFACIASLYHIINHAIFKSLLFLGAGSVISGTHTRNIEEYGGLIKRMPQTALFFLVGSLAISALPPFNGFFSEWLTFQSLFSGVSNLNLVAKMVFIISVGALAFTGGLAAACFVKAFGITFLARPRSKEASHAREVGICMRIGMGALSLLTLLFGFFAVAISGILRKIVTQISVFQNTSFNFIQSTGVDIGNEFASVSMPALFCTLLVLFFLCGIIVSLFCQKRKTTIDRTWDCGSDLHKRMEITATGFSRSIVVIFRSILRPLKKIETNYYDKSSTYFPKHTELTLELQDIYKSFFYRFFFEVASKISERVKKIQSGNMNAYIAYIFIALIILLMSLAF